MAEASEGRSLEETPTWAIAVVCFILVLISIIIDHVIHVIGNWLNRRQKRALYEALEKVKSELMLLGFISLLLTAGQSTFSNICISADAAATWHPCKKEEETQSTPSDQVAEEGGDGRRRRLLGFSDYVGNGDRRFLAAGSGTDRCAAKGKVPFVSANALNQLHIFIFVLAIFHVLYCIITMALGRAKMKRWKGWERETRTFEYELSLDPGRSRFTRDTSFGKRHMSFWAKNPILIWIVCFFRQFARSVQKVDYLTLRHGFITAHLAPHSRMKFNFQKYINRSLEEDIRAVVGISPPIWFFAVLFLLFNTHGWYSYLWLPFIPLIIILVVGTKLQVIITKMGLRIQESGEEIVRGLPVVKPGDDLFWFNCPGLILYLINFVLFQNAFQLAFFAWMWYEFGFKSCFHERVESTVIIITMGVLIQILCSYITLPLYALVTQMGSTMKPTIFSKRVATAVQSWHQAAKKHIKAQHKGSGKVTSLSSRPGTPSNGTSPLHLRHYQSDPDHLQTPSKGHCYASSNCGNYLAESKVSSSSPSHIHHLHPHHRDGDGSLSEEDTSNGGEFCEPNSPHVASVPQLNVSIGPNELSFGRM